MAGKRKASETYKKDAPEEQYTPAEMIEALTKTMGMKTKAARLLGCAYNTVQRYIDTYPEVQQAYDEAHEGMLDAIELKLFDRCMKDDTTAIIFALKTQGRKRGYQERVVNENHNIDLDKLTDDELRLIAEGKSYTRTP
jgi:hypothetical protein